MISSMQGWMDPITGHKTILVHTDHNEWDQTLATKAVISAFATWGTGYCCGFPYLL